VSEPKRYWMDDQNDADFPYEAVDGEWVKWENYARLKAEVERLRKAGDAMASSIQFNEEMEQDYNGPTIVRQCVKDWNAAKEGKQP
jgi:hypothetical protein